MSGLGSVVAAGIVFAAVVGSHADRPRPAHAQAPTPAALTYRVHLPVLWSNVTVSGEPAPPVGPVPTNVPPDPARPDRVVYAGCEERRSTDTDGDGRANERILARYDDGGRITWYAADDGADGHDDFTVRQTYRADGELLLEEDDSDGDGVVDTRIRHTFGGPGGLWIQTTAIEDVDGPNDSVMHYTFTGRFLTEQRVTKPDGTLDMWVKSTYDATGRRVHMDADFDGDDRAESTIDVLWDGDRIVEERSRATTVLGAIAYDYQYDYDAAGRLIERRFGEPEAKWRTASRYRYGASGFVERTETLDLKTSPPVVDGAWTYDYDAGRLVRIVRRPTGKPVETTTIAYTCPPSPAP